LSSPHSWNSFNTSHFSICIHKYIIFLLHSPSYTLFLYPPPLPLLPIYRQDPFYLPVLHDWKKAILFMGSFIVTFPCIITQIGSSLLFFSFLL
jgi:hypothetical protein